MLALLDFEAQLCGGCGGYLPETTDPDVSYEASPPGRCFRCTTLAVQQKEYEKQTNAAALRVWPIRKRERR